MDLVPLVTPWFPPALRLLISFGCQILLPSFQVLANRLILIDVHATAGKDKPLTTLFESITSNIFSTEQWFDQLRTAAILSDQALPGFVVNDEGFIQAARHTSEESALDVLAQRPARLQDLREHFGFFVRFERPGFRGKPLVGNRKTMRLSVRADILDLQRRHFADFYPPRLGTLFKKRNAYDRCLWRSRRPASRRNRRSAARPRAS